VDECAYIKEVLQTDQYLGNLLLIRTIKGIHDRGMHFSGNIFVLMLQEVGFLAYLLSRMGGDTRINA
jgi:hypothetical protein